VYVQQSVQAENYHSDTDQRIHYPWLFICSPLLPSLGLTVFHEGADYIMKFYNTRKHPPPFSRLWAWCVVYTRLSKYNVLGEDAFRAKQTWRQHKCGICINGIKRGGGATVTSLRCPYTHKTSERFDIQSDTKRICWQLKRLFHCSTYL
jgi:hypothetical protein